MLEHPSEVGASETIKQRMRGNRQVCVLTSLLRGDGEQVRQSGGESSSIVTAGGQMRNDR